MPKWRRFLAQFADPLVYAIAAVIVSLVAWLLEGADGVPFEVIVILAIIVANAVLGYVQEARAEEAVAALHGRGLGGVVRDERRIPVTDVVPGDLITLAKGDAIAGKRASTRAACAQDRRGLADGRGPCSRTPRWPSPRGWATGSTWSTAAPRWPAAGAGRW